jgi:hypothetical protein
LAGIHELVGGLVVVAFIVVVILAAILAAGRNPGLAQTTRIVSFIAAGLLLLQYILGVALLANNVRNTTTHYVIALLVLVPVALEHGAGRRMTPRIRGLAALIWALAATFLAIIAYLTGMQGAASVAP